MFLMPASLVERYVTRQYSGMDIRHFESKNLAATAYYFRLGPHAYFPHESKDVNVERDGFLVIPAGSAVNVASYESFKLPDNVFGMLGTQTAFPIKNQLMLTHGPFVDAGYDAPIELVIQNFGTSDFRLDFKARIGKITFFDISDSALEDARTAMLYAQRERQDRLRRVYGTDDENPDAPWQDDYH